MIYDQPPADFRPQFEVAAAFCLQNGEFLLVRRHASKVQGGRWSIPGGKVEPGETLPQTVRREVLEETGVDIPEDQLVYVGKVYVRYPEFDYVFHTFKCGLPERPEMYLRSDEHTDYCWATAEKALSMELVLHEDHHIQKYIESLT